ncbi:UxaA family hydrolase [Paenibacillus mendelii]|uniref:UxaA family hydrolase n=1 Tax=Paenibacillus mendelii TaxID=206163 RepID=A0ABV6JAA5_9BACL|nr:altronate dehydratase family protein [Paenibacillus mendelii]MCQ6559835.1 altronate dehydratase family protein [Paenibacillus mendelii]
MNNWIRLHEKDHVIIALRDYAKGEQLVGVNPSEDTVIELQDDVKKGHKIITRAVRQGEDVLKFGSSIGRAKQDLSAGSWVHTHNLGTGLSGIIDYSYMPDESVLKAFTSPAGGSQRTFSGYIRDNGDVGIRNEIWIINTVGCINKTCETLAQRASSMLGRQVDGVYHFAHPFGCSQLGDDLTYTQKLLASLVQHPNAAGVLVVGLGCENNQIDSFKQKLGSYDPERVLFMKAQEVEDELEVGLELIGRLAEHAQRFKRQAVPVSKLKLGLKCGGSDGLSGITANPLVGTLSDRLIGEGGSAILTEVPEMFGAETILMNRAASEEIFVKIVGLINDFKQYFIRHDQEIYENPSPGNKDGGISTLEEKSLGCTQKGGHAIVTDVVPYGGRVTKEGLSLLEAPGNDLVSVTALAAAGAHIVLFTTGRGTPFGGPVPTVKISTNSELADRKKNWIDYNAGQLIEGKPMNELTDELWEQIIRYASGEEETKNERNGFREIAIFKDGVIL